MRRSVAEVLRAFEDGRDRAEFYRGWRAGVSAGLTHPQILATVGESKGMTAAIRSHLLAGTTKGLGIAALVKQRPALFEPFESAMLTLGDEGGQLDSVLLALADFFMRQYRMMTYVKKQLAYPMFTSFFAIFIAPLPLVFMGQARAYVAAVSLGVLGWVFLGGSVLAGRAQTYQRRPPFVRARLARALAMTIEAGLPLGRAAVLSADASGLPELSARVRSLNERELTSQPLSRTFAGVSVMTPEFMAALEVAERTGDYSNTLRRLAALYEDGFK